LSPTTQSDTDVDLNSYSGHDLQSTVHATFTNIRLPNM